MHSNRLPLLLLAFFVVSMTLFSQPQGVNREKHRIHIKHTAEKISIDGVFDEDTWKTAERSGKLARVTPTDTGYAIAQTEVMLSYDELNIYIAAICYDPTPGKRIIQIGRAHV